MIVLSIFEMRKNKEGHGVLKILIINLVKLEGFQSYKKFKAPGSLSLETRQV